MHFSFMPAVGIGIALNSLVGHSIGEGKNALALLQTRACMVATGVYMGLIGLIFLLARYFLMEIISAGPGGLPSDPIVVQIGAGILIWAAVFQIFDAAAITYMSALRGAGDTTIPAVFSVVNCWIVFVGGGWYLSRWFPEWGVHSLWMMCTLYIILYGLFLWWRWSYGPWRQIRLFDKDKPGGGFPVGRTDESREAADAEPVLETPPIVPESTCTGAGS